MPTTTKTVKIPHFSRNDMDEFIMIYGRQNRLSTVSSMCYSCTHSGKQAIEVRYRPCQPKRPFANKNQQIMNPR